MTPAAVLRANALHLPLADESVDLAVTSPPYFALRSYRDMAWVIGPDGQMQPEQVHFAGQIGSEPTPQAFLEALWAVTAELWRVLKPSGSVFVNLGDKRATSGGHDAPGISSSSTLRGNGHVGGVGKAGPQKIKTVPRSAHEFDRQGLRARLAGTPPNRASRSTKGVGFEAARFGRAKSKMLLPHRYAEGCEDGLADPCIKDHEHVGQHPAYTEAERCRGRGWVVRSDIVWSKPNGLPESVTDRVRDAHEYVFHLTKEGRYFAGVDEVREPHSGGSHYARKDGHAPPGGKLERLVASGDRAGTVGGTNPAAFDPRGKLPGSVWTIASEPLRVPEELGVDHFAAFPTALPLRCIRGWSPVGICTACGEGRRPVAAKENHELHVQGNRGAGHQDEHGNNRLTEVRTVSRTEVTITGYACACPSPDAPTRPAVVLDPFGGTGTTAAVARALGRTGISVDLSADYCRLARWRIEESGDGERAVFGARPPRQVPGQASLALFDL